MNSLVESPETRLENAKKALTVVVGRFRERELGLNPLNDFGTFFESIGKSTADIADKRIAPFASRLEVIARDVIFTKRVIESKVLWIAIAAKDCLEKENLLVLAYCARALIEHCAAIVWLADKVEQFTKSLENKANESLLDKAFKKMEANLTLVYYNKKGEDFVHITEMRKVLARRVQNESEVYGLLCDYLHPNYGSNLLVSSGELGRGFLNPSVMWRIDEVASFTTIAGQSIQEIEVASDEIDVDVVHYLGLMKLAQFSNMKMETWLSSRTAKALGDGLSRETALWFPKSRTKEEAMRRLDEHFNVNHIEVVSQVLVDADAHWSFDTIETNVGLLWVRLPISVL